MYADVMTQLFNNLVTLSRHSCFAAATWIAVVLLAPASLALEADRLEQVLWSSDGGSTTRTEGDIRILEFSDNVRVTQGSLEILGDHAVFEYDAASNRLQRVTVRGTPVRYQQQLDEEGAVVGSSETVLMYRDQEADQTLIEFIGNAVITSPEATTRCSAIVYITELALIPETTGPCEGTLSPSNN